MRSRLLANDKKTRGGVSLPDAACLLPLWCFPYRCASLVGIADGLEEPGSASFNFPFESSRSSCHLHVAHACDYCLKSTVRTLSLGFKLSTLVAQLLDRLDAHCSFGHLALELCDVDTALGDPFLAVGASFAHASGHSLPCSAVSLLPALMRCALRTLRDHLTVIDFIGYVFTRANVVGLPIGALKSELHLSKLKDCLYLP